MHLELGPVGAGDVQQWARFARRVVSELRVAPADLAGVATDDLLRSWSDMIDRWEHDAAIGDEVFRWSADVDVELAEYLLHGLDRTINSDGLRARLDRGDHQHWPFTLHVAQALIDGLGAEGRCQEHLCDQVRVTLGSRLDH